MIGATGNCSRLRETEVEDASLTSERLGLASFELLGNNLLVDVGSWRESLSSCGRPEIAEKSFARLFVAFLRPTKDLTLGFSHSSFLSTTTSPLTDFLSSSLSSSPKLDLNDSFLVTFSSLIAASSSCFLELTSPGTILSARQQL